MHEIATLEQLIDGDEPQHASKEVQILFFDLCLMTPIRSMPFIKSVVIIDEKFIYFEPYLCYLKFLSNWLVQLLKYSFHPVILALLYYFTPLNWSVLSYNGKTALS